MPFAENHFHVTFIAWKKQPPFNVFITSSSMPSLSSSPSARRVEEAEGTISCALFFAQCLSLKKVGAWGGAVLCRATRRGEETGRSL